MSNKLPGGPLKEHPSHTIPLKCEVHLKPLKQSANGDIEIEVRAKEGLISHETKKIWVSRTDYDKLMGMWARQNPKK